MAGSGLTPWFNIRQIIEEGRGTKRPSHPAPMV